MGPELACDYMLVKANMEARDLLIRNQEKKKPKKMKNMHLTLTQLNLWRDKWSTLKNRNFPVPEQVDASFLPIPTKKKKASAGKSQSSQPVKRARRARNNQEDDIDMNTLMELDKEELPSTSKGIQVGNEIGLPSSPQNISFPEEVLQLVYDANDMQAEDELDDDLIFVLGNEEIEQGPGGVAQEDFDGDVQEDSDGIAQEDFNEVEQEEHNEMPSQINLEPVLVPIVEAGPRRTGRQRRPPKHLDEEDWDLTFSKELLAGDEKKKSAKAKPKPKSSRSRRSLFNDKK